MGDCKHLAVRGAVCLMHGVKFDGDPDRHSKYCVLLEGYVEGKRDIVVAYGTSSLEFHHVLSSFLITRLALAGQPPDDTLIQLDNRAIVPKRKLFGKWTFYIGQLTADLVRQLDDALVHLYVEPEVWLRMCG